jgi:hypothetical protein
MTADEFIAKMAEGVDKAGGGAPWTLQAAEEAGLDFAGLHAMSDKWYPLGYPTPEKLGELLEQQTRGIEEDLNLFIREAAFLGLYRAVRCPNEMAATGLFEVRGMEPGAFLLDEIPEDMLIKLQIEGMPPGEVAAQIGDVDWGDLGHTDWGGALTATILEAAEEQGQEGVHVLLPLFSGASRPDGEPDYHWRVFEFQGMLFNFR